MQQQSNYLSLIQKLDQFIRKFYLNQLIKGSLISIGLILGVFLAMSIMEHFFYFDTGVRKLFFYAFVGLVAASIGRYVIIPMLHYFKLGKVLTNEQAAVIIGNHFGDVKDRLLNILQLKKQADQTQSDLLLASIEQKTDTIKLVPFKSAIDLSQNRKYLRYALPPFLILVGILFMAPSWIKDSSYRIINNNTKFEKAAPFALLLGQEEFKVVQNEDFTITVIAEGSALPAEVFVEVDGFDYRLQPGEVDGQFTYTFKNVQKDIPFRIHSGRVETEENLLKVLMKPTLAELAIALDYPGYISRKDETVFNIGDLLVPEGTIANWQIKANHTDEVFVKFGEEALKPLSKRGQSDYQFKKQLVDNEAYKLYYASAEIPMPDSLQYIINVVKDQYPTIKVEEVVDSLEKNIRFFIGSASDDYGLQALSFNYTVMDEKGRLKAEQSIKIMDPDARETQYQYTWDTNELNLQPGDQVSYFFRVYDNDGVNGRKPAETSILKLEKPTIEEFEELENANEEEIKDNLKQAKEDLEKMQENFRKMREKLLQEKELDWQDKEEIDKLLEEQQKLQERLEKAKEKFEENLKNQEEFSEQKEEILEKQEKLQELFEEALNPETQELMEKIQEMLQELNRDQALEMMEQMEMNDEQMEMEMDRLLELYKNLEVEKEMKEQMEKLQELAKKQEELAKDNEEKQQPTEENKEAQEKLNEEFDKLKEEMKETQEKNKALERPKETPEDSEEKMEDIQQDMQDSQQQMENSDSKGASKKQKSAAQKMEQMAGAMASAMQGGEEEQNAEDIKAIRQLLENLVDLSFDQEDLISQFEVTKTVVPKYVDLIQDQFKLKDDFVMIEDSLRALAKRNDKIESFVLDKVQEVKTNLKESIDLLEERTTNQAISAQRTTMTNVNDLALMLNESMENMQESMAASMPGSQMCDKPGGKGQGKGGKVPMDKITEGQQGMDEQLQQMMQNAKDGKGNSSKDFAQAAARQAALRKALQDLAREKSEQGQGAKELQDIIDMMNKIETDLVNKQLDAQLLARQQDIKTRLLEAEKAERQREWDNKRKADVGNDKQRELPPALQEYLKKREAEIDMYKKISPSLRPHYKYLVDEYYKALKSN